MATATTFYGAFEKDPDERSVRTTDWCDLAVHDFTADPISTSTWEVDDGTVVAEIVNIFTGTVAEITFTGGDAGESSVIRNRITTVAGMIFDRSFIVAVQEK